MEKRNTNQGYLRNMLNKLHQIWSDFAKLDEDWQQLDFPKPIDVLGQSVKRKPVTEAEKDRPPIRKQKNVKARLQNATYWKYMFCYGPVHKLNDLAEVKDLVKTRQIVSSKKLCFKGLKSGHCSVHGSSCTWFKCNWKPYTLFCILNQLQNNSSKRDQEPKEKMLGLVVEKNICYPVMAVYASEIQFRALVDTGAQSSYASAALTSHISASHVKWEMKQTDMLLHTTSKKIKIHNLIIIDREGLCQLNVYIQKGWEGQPNCTKSRLKDNGSIKESQINVQNYQSTLLLEQVTSQ